MPEWDNGQMMTTNLIENYPGFPKGVTGFDLEFRRQEVLEPREMARLRPLPWKTTWKS